MADTRDASRAAKRRADTRDPRRSRERALKILFQADVRGIAAEAVLDRIVDDPRAWAMLDDLDPEEVASLDPGEGAAGTPGIDAGDAAADPEPRRPGHADVSRAMALDGFTRSLVQGVADHQAQLDELIQRYARRWTVSRMPVIDRNVLRLGTYELAYETTSPAVVINEVIELAKRLSTEDSGRYVNGVLESVRKHLADAPLESLELRDDDEVSPAVPDVADPPPFDVAEDDVVPAGPDAVAAPPFEPDAEVVAQAPDLAEPTGDEPVAGVLPPPDDEGDAVDLLADPTPEEPSSADDVDDDAEADPDDPADGHDEPADGHDEPDDPGPAQQQLF